jgi:hypothetical protein
MTFFTPFLFFVASVTQIQLTSQHTIQSHIIPAFTTVQSDFVGFEKKHYIIIKAFLESQDKQCKSLIGEAIATCQKQIETCDCSISSDKEILIKALQTDLKTTQEQLKQSRQYSKLFKYLSIGFASVALSSSAYIILK